MASDISSSAAFGTVNYRPAPDENIDALWGQNIADNTGFLYGRPVLVPPFQSISARCVLSGAVKVVAATTILDVPFYRIPGHNTVIATMVGTTLHDSTSPTTYDNYGTLQWGIYGDLGTFLATDTYTVLNTSQYSRVTSWGTTVSLTPYVSVGSQARFRYTVGGTTTDPDVAGTMQFDFGRFSILTKWV